MLFVRCIYIRYKVCLVWLLMLVSTTLIWANKEFPLLKKDSMLNEKILIEKSIKLYQNIKEYREEGNWEKVGEIYQSLSNISKTKNEVQNVLKYNDSAFYYFFKNKDTLNSIELIVDKARFLRKHKMFSESMESFLRAKDLAELSKNKIAKVKVLNEISSVYLAIKDYKKTRKVLLQLMSLTNDSTLSKSNLSCYNSLYNNYGNVLIRLKKTDSAIYYLNHSLELAKDKDLSQCHILSTLSEAYVEKKEYDTALQYALAANKNYLKTKISYRPNTELLISECYLGLGDKASAYKYLKKAYEVAYINGSVFYRLKVEERMSNYYKGIKDYEQALYHKNRYHKLFLKSYNSEKINEVLRVESKKELSEKENEINKLSKNRKKIILISLASLGVLALLFYFQKIRTEKHIAISQSKEAISKLEALHSKMNPHFLFNTISSIQNKVLNLERIKAYNMLESFSELLRIMLRNSDNINIKLSEELNFLELYLSFYKLRQGDRFEYILDVDTKAIGSNPLIPSMMLQPHIENAIIHAFPNNYEGTKKLIVTLKEVNKGIHVSIADNGIGREASFKNKKYKKTLSISTNNLKKRIEHLRKLGYKKANIEIRDLYKREKPIGTSVEVYLPYVLI
ncbi:protein of unknown function [Tenacibaculum sp. 190524A02b]|uniref:Signal transduction histidine kinase internal region domain-containing protein n=2 Tax=Tenacibaculum vairaonense TaxID=3137860 RepID=A0ABM9PHX1_9FLAO